MRSARVLCSFACNPIQLGALFICEPLNALSRVARGFIAFEGCSFELADRPLDFSPGLEKISPCFLARRFFYFPLALGDVALAFRDPSYPLSRVFRDLGHLALGGAQRFLPLLELREERRYPPLVRRHALFGTLDNVARKMEPARNAQSVRSSRYPLDQAIRRRERDGVELERCVDDAIDFDCQLLERAEVRGCDRHRSPRGQRLEYRASQRGTFDWIGARSELVDQNERPARRRIENFGEILQVRAESGKARENRLLVTDVGEDVVDD